MKPGEESLLSVFFFSIFKYQRREIDLRRIAKISSGKFPARGTLLD